MALPFLKNLNWHCNLTMVILLPVATLWSCGSDDEDDGQPPVPPANLYDWTNQQSLSLVSLKDIDFVDNNFGWAVGEELVLTTSTGGVSWQPAPLESSSQPGQINSITFVNRQQGWLAGSADDETGEIFITQQGGAYPILQQSYQDPLQAIYFLNGQLGWASGNTGKVVHTTDGGSAWEIIADLGVDLFDVYFTTEMKGWVAGDNGTLFKTTDGTIFQTEDLGIDHRLNSIHFVDTLHGWVCGARNTVFRRHLNEDNQIVWSDVSVAQASAATDWNDICFIDRLTGWVVGTEGFIYRTTDGGQSWERESIETAENLNAISMVSTSKGWIAGDQGLIFTYTP